MAKNMLRKRFVIIGLFVLVSLLLPSIAFASEKPVLIDDSVSDFIVSSLIDVSKAEKVDEDEMLGILIDGKDERFSYGTVHKFELFSPSDVALELDVGEVSEVKGLGTELSDVSLLIRAPSGKEFVIGAGTMMVIDLPEIGEYELQILSKRSSAYSMMLYELKVPFITNVGVIGPYFDFEGKRTQIESYIKSGKDVVIYDNRDAEEYLDIRREKEIVSDDVSGEAEIDDIFSDYFPSGEELENISSDLATDVLVSYRGINMVLLFEGGPGDGNIIVLNPAVLSMGWGDVSAILETVAPEAVSDEVVKSDFEKVVTLSEYVLIVLALLVSYLVVGGILMKFVKEKEYLRLSFKRIGDNKARIGKIVLLINILVLAVGLILAALGAFILNRYETSIMHPNLWQSIEHFRIFINDYAEIERITFIPIVLGIVFLLFDLVILVWLNLDFIVKTRDFLWEKTVGRIPIRLRKLLGRVILYLSILSFMLTAYILLVDSPIVLRRMFLAISIICGLLLPAFHFREGLKLSETEEWVVKIFLVLVAVSPFALFSNTIYKYISPLGISVTESFGKSDLASNSESNSYILKYSPFFEEKNVKTVVGQKLKSSGPVYFQPESSYGRKIFDSPRLLFDKDLVNFTEKQQYGDHFVYSRSKLQRDGNLEAVLSSNLDEGSFVGVDKYSYTDSYLESEQKLVLADYYNSFEYNGGEIDQEIDISGDIIFYTVLGDVLDLEIVYDDLNNKIGLDEFVIDISDSSGNIVASTYVEDYANVLFHSDTNLSINLLKHDLDEGLYKISLRAPGYWNVAGRMSSDIVFRRIRINSDKLVFSTLDSSIFGGSITFEEDTNLYFIPMETVIERSRVVGEDFFSENDCNASGSGGTPSQRDLLPIVYKDSRIFELGDESLDSISLTCLSNMISSNYTIYSFSPESYFYPFRYYFTDIDKSDEIAVSRSNLNVREIDGWYYSEIEYTDSYKLGEDIDFRFLGPPDLDDFYSSYLVDEVVIDLESE
ncbi:hypothetical protein JW710_02580 [Candidatus Dojkabacteria bacterium]|nr:hypothetical protein [Candidatus Dojkabacteria bacterium]